MTVATAIEMVAGKAPAQGMGKCSGAAPGTEWRAASAQVEQTPSALGTTSFRAGWQLLIARMDSSSAAENRIEAGKDSVDAASQRLPRDTAGKSPVSASVQPSLAAVRQQHGTEVGSNMLRAAAESTATDARSAVYLVRKSAGSASCTTAKSRPVTASAEQSKKAASSGSRSGDDGGAAKAINVSGLVDATATPPMASPDALTYLPQTALAASPEIPVSNPRTQASLAEHSMSSSSSLASADLGLRSQMLYRSSEDAGAAKGGRQAYAFRSELAHPQTPIQSALLTPAQGQSLIPNRGLALLPAATLTMPIIQRAAQQAAPGEKTPETQTARLNERSAQPATPLMSRAADSLPSVDLVRSLDIPNSSASQPAQLAADPHLAVKSGLLEVGKADTTESSRSAHKSTLIGPVQQGSPVEQRAAFPPEANHSAIAHGLTGGVGDAKMTDETADISTRTTFRRDTREAFATLDAAGPTGNTTWIHAGAQRAEVGFQDPALGWVGVRADLSGGGVHAQLIPGSTEAAQTLSSHMAGLNGYLAEHHTAVETLTLKAPEAGWSGYGGGHSAGAGTQQGAGQQAGGQTAEQSASADFHFGASSERAESSAAVTELPASFVGHQTSTEVSWPGGTHISVLA
jgi:hypothetical protein